MSRLGRPARYRFDTLAVGGRLTVPLAPGADPVAAANTVSAAARAYRARRDPAFRGFTRTVQQPAGRIAIIFERLPDAGDFHQLRRLARLRARIEALADLSAAQPLAPAQLDSFTRTIRRLEAAANQEARACQIS